jgi:Acyl carrier protein
MDKDAILEQLNEIFQDVFDDDELVVTRETTAKDVEGWDSLMQIMLVVAIEKAYEVKFAMKEVTAAKNVGDMVDLIASKL